MSLLLHHHPLSSYCWKVMIGLDEAGVPHEAVEINIGDPEAKAAFERLWPTAKIPLLEDRDAGRVVPETSIMLEYADRGGRLLPSDPEARLEARLWDRLFDNYVMTPMGRIVADRLRPEAERDAVDAAARRAELQKAYAMIDGHMASRTWAAGDDFSLADCAAAPSLFYATVIEPPAGDMPNLRAYLDRLLARPSVAKVIDRARPVFQYFPFAGQLPAQYRA
jgi:glutathione S-transferase